MEVENVNVKNWKSLIKPSKLDVQISEPDVSPLQLQGPNSGKIMEALFGKSINNLKYYLGTSNWTRSCVHSTEW